MGFEVIIANRMLVTRILHGRCQIVSEYPTPSPTVKLCVHLYKENYRPDNMFRKYVSSIKGPHKKLC